MQELILPVIVVSLGFAIFLLSNLQKNILIKIFGWLVSVIVIIFGTAVLTKTVTLNAVKGLKKSGITKSAGDKLYKKAELNKIFDEVNKAWKEK